ncbi:MAG: hypothetical protein L3J31_05625 [Bacteroidales bacterium]|nr:hypothetical protein [Bacteroidales bacterium]MCF6342269.1 hypothetical protein [Bacteroidales bacterium]
MNQTLKIFSRLLLVSLVFTLVLGSTTSCTSKKKLAKEKAEALATEMNRAKRDLNNIIDGETTWTLDQQAEKVAAIKAKNWDNADVDQLIEKAEETISRKRAEAERLAEEERLRREEEARLRANQSEFAVIDNQLGAIAGASSVDEANRQINTALNQFATPDIPVLIIISQAGGFNDYDRPTTITKFLNYLKDKKQYKYKVESVKRDGLGKITEMELIVK